MSPAGPGVGFDADVAVVGSGFGGAVAALRLTEKGYRVVVLEAGARFADDEFPKTSWDVRRFLFAPALGCYGIQRIDVLDDCLILSGAGVGGGSLVYANTLYEPADAFFDDPSWSGITDWRQELAPYYDQASRMLGVATNPTMTPSDEVIKQVADEMGVGHTFRLTPVGVFFGEAGRSAADPYFGGAGPVRRGCIECGECMTGCRHGAKNTLVKNYLHLAEAGGASVRALTTVVRVAPLPGGGFAVTTVPTKGRGAPSVLRAEQVVLAASTLGTQRLLHRMKDEGALPGLSSRLGHLTRTNSESIVGAVAHSGAADFSRGVAISSSFHPDPATHIEPVRYGRGSNAMGLMQTVLTDDVPGVPRWRTWLRELWRQRRDLPRLYDLRHWSERTVIALAMQSLDNSITVTTRPARGLGRLFGRRRLTSTQGHGKPNPTWIPAANDAVRRMAAIVGGTPGGTIGEPFKRPLTAHFIGGCGIGETPALGVIDPYHRVHGYPGLHIVDGSAISANLGVNPSLTITAQAERAMALWPNKGEADPRPAPGAAYVPLPPVPPRDPAVPETAPAALRLP